MEAELKTSTGTVTVSDPSTIPVQSPVDRQRRFFFISRVVAFCLISAASFTAAGAYFQINAAILSNFVDGMMSLANVVTIAYVSGSVLDYNGALSGLFARKSS